MNNKFFALVTGSAGLLGQSHCEALAEINYNLILTDIDKPKLIKQYKFLKSKFKNLNILYYIMDVSQETSVKNIYKKLLAKKIKLKIIINNAAVDSKIKKNYFSKNNSLEIFDIKRWNKEINVGLTGAFLTSKFFCQNFLKYRTPGVIINIASDLSVIAPDQRIYGKRNFKPVTYSTIKSGLVGLTKYLATYYASKNIRCNVLSPGGIRSEQSINFIKKIENLIPLKRMAKKDEYKEAIKFMCSENNKYMTGQNIIIDGGRSVW